MGQARDFDIVVLGDCNPDIVLRGDDVRPVFGQHEILVPEAAFTIGGSGSITACACARAGLRTRFVGAVGDDVFGRFMLEQLNSWGVDTALCPVLAAEATGFSVVLSKGQDRAILTHPGAIGALRVEHLSLEELARARHLHLGSYFLQPALVAQIPTLLKALRARGVTVSVDPNWDPSGTWDGGLRTLIGQIDIFLPNAAEARLLTQLPSVREAAVELARGGALVVVKRGTDGCLAVKGRAIYEHPGFAVNCVDTTGAGDAFDAGFLRGCLDERSLGECLAYGCAMGALSTRAVGATGALATISEVSAFITASKAP